jgi:RHS repeat-associated protein
MLLAESDGAGIVQKEYIWLDGMPLAQVFSGALYFVHADQLGTAQAITDATQAIVWDAAYAPFGEQAVAAGSFPNNLRFPGQYFDAETGTHYNYQRTYDPSIGRYVQSDPIGLRGGVNTYAYVAGNPIRLLDRFGLEVQRWGRVADLPFPLNQFDHQWLKTDRYESGMGPMNGQVPGQEGRSDWPFDPTQTVDHSGQSNAPNARRIRIPFPVDEQCIDRLIAPGRPTGRWTPLNQCQSFVDDVLNQCRIQMTPMPRNNQ